MAIICWSNLANNLCKAYWTVRTTATTFRLRKRWKFTVWSTHWILYSKENELHCTVQIHFLPLDKGIRKKLHKWSIPTPRRSPFIHAQSPSVSVCCCSSFVSNNGCCYFLFNRPIPCLWDTEPYGLRPAGQRWRTLLLMSDWAHWSSSQQGSWEQTYSTVFVKQSATHPEEHNKE